MHWSPTCHDPSYTKPRPSLMYTSSNRNMANKMNFLSYANSTTWAFWSKCPLRKKRKGLISVAWYLAKSTNLFIALVLACLLCSSHRQSCVGWGQEKGETRWYMYNHSTFCCKEDLLSLCVCDLVLIGSLPSSES